MGANLVYLTRPNKDKATSFGIVPIQENQIGYEWACSAM